MEKYIKVGNKEEEMKRCYGWEYRHLCYTGYNSKPFKVDENNYQIKCICNAGGLSVNRFKEVYLNFNLKELNITEERFLSHFVLPGYLIEFEIQYDYAKKYQNLLYVYYYERNRKFTPSYDPYGRFSMVFNKLDKMKPQDKAKIDVPNPNYYTGK